MFRTVAGLCVLAGAAIAGPVSASLPRCPPAEASDRAPTEPAGPRSAGACRAEGQSRPPGVTPRGYQHLGAGTGGEWAGVSGRMEVVDSSVRPKSYDFVAGRFMVKRDLGGGRIAWLEAGWAETGWASAGRQHIYTFNSDTKTWQFYDQYALKPGDRVWVDLHTDTNGIWQAWLWWNNRWNLLTARKLPIGRTAYVEQYVEVHVDARRSGRVDVPPVTVDNVKLRPAGGGPDQAWRADVATLIGDLTGPLLGGLCLNWMNRYDTWRAGSCRR